jgi:hypothetical protein
MAGNTSPGPAGFHHGPDAMEFNRPPGAPGIVRPSWNRGQAERCGKPHEDAWYGIYSPIPVSGHPQAPVDFAHALVQEDKGASA